MNISFNNRYDVQGGRSYHARDFKPGPAQEAGLWPPTWFQFPKPILGLPETPTIEACTNLLDNKSPDGKQRLTLRSKTTRLEAGKEVANHRADHELTFSAWKWLTILALCYGDRRILTVWQNTIEEALILTAKFAATRVRKDDADHDRSTGHIIGLLFHHIESRAGDPQLHSHGIIFNVTWDPVESCFKALQFDPILQQERLIRGWVAARLYEELWCLGYDLEPAKDGFRIAGVPVEAEIILSKRANSLKDAVQSIKRRKGKVTWKQKKDFIVYNRPTKKSEDWATMHERWRGELADHNEVLAKVVADAEGRQRKQIPRLERHGNCAGVMDTTLNDLLEKHACVTPERLLACVLARADGRWNGTDAKAVLDLQLKKGCYVREIESSITTPARRVRQHDSLMQAHAAIGPQGSMIVRSAHPNLQHALHLAISGAKIIVAATTTTAVCKAAVRGLDSGLRLFGLSPIYAVPASVHKPSPSKPLSQALAETGYPVVVGQAEKITQSELDDIINFVAHPGNQVILLASQIALKDRKNPSLIAAFARHRWVPLTDLTYSEPKSKRQSRNQLVPPSLRMINRYADRAVSKVAEIAVRFLVKNEMVQVLTDDRGLETVLSAEIENQLGRCGPEPARTIPTFNPKPSAPPQMGDTAISELKTRHFGAGECVSVVEVSGSAITVKKADGKNKTVTPKVWHKLIHIDVAEIQIRPGTVLTLTAGVPGKKHRLGKGTYVQVKGISETGAISLTNGEELPAWFRFLELGYVTSPTRTNKKLTGKAIVFLRKRPNRTMRFLIRDLLRTGKLLKVAAKTTAHLKRMSTLAVKLKMAKLHPYFTQPEQQPTKSETSRRSGITPILQTQLVSNSEVIVNSSEKIALPKYKPSIPIKTNAKTHYEPNAPQQPDHP